MKLETIPEEPLQHQISTERQDRNTQIVTDVNNNNDNVKNKVLITSVQSIVQNKNPSDMTEMRNSNGGFDQDQK